MAKSKYYWGVLLGLLLLLTMLPAVALAEVHPPPGGGGGGGGVPGPAVLSMSADTGSVQQVGDEFTVDVLLANVCDLAGVAFEVRFDPSVLEVVKDADGNSITVNSEIFKQSPDDFGPSPFYRKDTSSSARVDGIVAEAYYDNGDRLLSPIDIGDPVKLGTIKFQLINEAPAGTRLDFSYRELADLDAQSIPHEAKSLLMVLPPPQIDAPVIITPVDNTRSNDNQPVVGGTGLAGAALSVFDGGNLVASAVVPENGNWSIQVGPLDDGLHYLSAIQELGGLVSPKSNVVRYVVDTVAPQPPVITSPPDGATVTTLRPEITGTGEYRATVTVYYAGGNEVLGTVTVGNEGRWKLTPSFDLTDGESYQITAKQQDRAGNESLGSDAVSFTVDTGAVAGELAELVISPGYVKIGVLRTVDFIVTGYDENGVVVENLQPVWDAVDGLGSIDAYGKFTALTPGLETVRVTVAGFQGYAEAEVDIFNLPGVSLGPSQAVGMNREFVVNVLIENAEDLKAFNVDIGFDPSYLRVVKLQSGGFLTDGVPLFPEYNNDTGTISYAEYTLANSASGSGTLLEITLQAKKPGIYQWTLPEYEPNQPIKSIGLLNSEADYMDYNPGGATIEIVTGGSIAGKIVYQNGQFIGNNQGIKVELWNNDQLVAQTTTADDGSYLFSGVAGEGYKVVAYHDGYLKREQKDISVGAGDLAEVSFELRFGDFNKNNIIDLQDVTMVATKYRQQPEDEMFDYNRNNLIDLQDITAVAQNYRKKYPPGY